MKSKKNKFLRGGDQGSQRSVVKLRSDILDLFISLVIFDFLFEVVHILDSIFLVDFIKFEVGVVNNFFDVDSVISLYV